MKIQSIRTFIPSNNFELSKKFYKDIGFEIRWENEELCIFGDDGQTFFLQDYYVADWANNCMMQLFVEDLIATYKVCEEVVSKYEGTKIKEIFETDYGMTFHLIDPSGVLWHFTSSKEKYIDENKLLCNDQ